MRKRSFAAASPAAFFLIIIGISCTKIDTTTLGSDLVTIDNVHTFADTLPVIATQGFFSDSTTVQKTDNQVVGNLTTDPLFGKTNSAIYVQFKPDFYPFYFGNAGDTVKNDPNGNANLDSAFITLSYVGLYGDSLASTVVPQTFEVRQITDADFRDYTDSVRKLNYQPAVNSTVLGSAVITPQIANAQTILAYGRDSVSSQIRIKLNAAGMAVANDIYYNQSSSATGPNNALYNDSLFRDTYNGFAITSNGAGNTLFYVNLNSVKTRMEFHFHKTKSAVKDTVVESFHFYPVAFGAALASSSSDYVKRDYTGAQIQSPLANNVYLQTSPGTYASLQIPGLTGYSNRIVHRAFLITEQTPDNPATDAVYPAPLYLYLDLKDTITSTPQRYKPIYFDLSSVYSYNPDATDLSSLYHPYPFGNVDLNNFGGGALNRIDAFGNAFTRYEINITRYVQHIVTNGYHNYDLRLYAPYNYYYPQYPGTQYIIPYFNPLAYGRVRVGSGSNTAHPMRLVVIYSKI